MKENGFLAGLSFLTRSLKGSDQKRHCEIIREGVTCELRGGAEKKNSATVGGNTGSAALREVGKHGGSKRSLPAFAKKERRRRGGVGKELEGAEKV